MVNELCPINHRQLASFLFLSLSFFFDQISKLGESGEIIFVLSGKLYRRVRPSLPTMKRNANSESVWRGSTSQRPSSIGFVVGRLNIQALSFWLLSKPPSIFWWISFSLSLFLSFYIYSIYVCVFLTSESRSRVRSQNIEHNSAVEGPRGAVQVAVVSSINRQRATEPTHILTDSRIIRLVSPSISSARETRSDPTLLLSAPPVPTLTDVDATTPTK